MEFKTVVDVFRDKSLFQGLEVHNNDIREACKIVTYNHGRNYDIPNNKVSSWFDPDNLGNLGLSATYPKATALSHDPKFKLILYFPNYVTLCLVNRIYRDKKDVLIEDMAGGMGRLIFYLSKLGFSNFHIYDNFSQVSPQLLARLMEIGGIQYALNDNALNPVVINIVGWGRLTRDVIPESVEILFAYRNLSLTRLAASAGECDYEVEVKSEVHKPMDGFVPFCMDTDAMMRVFCRKDKLEEFREKISSMVIEHE